jgi:hypothetical protein
VYNIYNAFNLSVCLFIDTDIVLAASTLTVTKVGSQASLDNASYAYEYRPRTFAAAASVFVRKIFGYVCMYKGWAFYSPCTSTHSGLLCLTPMIDEDDFWSNWWNENWQGKIFG